MYIINGKGQIIRIIAGILIVVSAMLGFFASKYYLLFTALVGVMLTLSGTTGFCPMEMLLRKFSYPEKELR